MLYIKLISLVINCILLSGSHFTFSVCFDLKREKIELSCVCRHPYGAI